jgi:PKD repeat protein
MKSLINLSISAAVFFMLIVSCTKEIEPEIDVAFATDNTSLIFGEEVFFTDSSSGNPTMWEWNFEGGTPSTSNDANPSVVYGSPGVYNVILKASNKDHSDVLIKDKYIRVYEKLKALIDINDSIVNEGSEVIFTDLSEGKVTGWEWIFEGGIPSTSSEPNPIIKYSSPGIYTATLKVLGDLEPNGNTSSKKIVVLPTSELIAYYPFNGDSNDEWVNNLNGTLIGGACLTYDKYGNANNAVHFNGVDARIEIENNLLLEPQQFTISAWIKAENESGVIVSLTNFSPVFNNCGYILAIKYGNMRGFSNIGTGNWAMNIDDAIVSLNEWHNLIFSYDGQSLNLYFDGGKVSSEVIPHTVNYSEHNPLQIGSYSSQSGASAFTGDIDNVRIFGRALNEIEIEALSNE